MKKTIAFIIVMLLINVALQANTTMKATYEGSNCGDLCYMNFKTDKGTVSLYGYIEDFKGVKEGKSYIVTYERIKIEVVDLGKLEVNGVVDIKLLTEQ